MRGWPPRSNLPVPNYAGMILRMILPLGLLLANRTNRYELCAATMRRAEQLSVAADDEVDANGGKVVPTAVKQILTQKVRYEIER